MAEPADHGDMRLLLGLVLGGIVTLSIAVAIGAALDVEPGSLAEWVEGVSTFVALLAASYAAVQAGRVFKLERGRDAQRDRADRQRQAELVAVWAGEIESQGPLVTHEFVPGHAPKQTVAAGAVHPVSIPVTIRNASDLPVYGLSVDVYVEGPNTDGPQLAGQREITSVENGLAIMGTIPNVEVVTRELIESMIPVIDRVQGALLEPPTIYIGWTFKDNAGVRWRHHPGGRLEDLDNSARVGV